MATMAASTTRVAARRTAPPAELGRCGNAAELAAAAGRLLDPYFIVREFWGIIHQ
jgi:hypothetical protein